MLKNIDTPTNIDGITREIYIEKLHEIAAEYTQLFIRKPWLKNNQKASEECKKIGTMIRDLRFNKKIPDEKHLDAAIQAAEAEATCMEMFYA